MAEDTKERMRQLFLGRPLEQRFLVEAVAELLDEEQMTAVLDRVQPVSNSIRGKYKDLPLITFSGLSRDQIKSNFGFDDSNVDEIYGKLGVTEGTDENAPNRDADGVVNQGLPQAGSSEDEAKAIAENSESVFTVGREPKSVESQPEAEEASEEALAEPMDVDEQPKKAATKASKRSK
jgi:hypothetical protein